jgi:hypothetical protein
LLATSGVSLFFVDTADLEQAIRELGLLGLLHLFTIAE